MAERTRIEELVALNQLNIQRRAEGLHEQKWEDLLPHIRESYINWAKQIIPIIRQAIAGEIQERLEQYQLKEKKFSRPHRNIGDLEINSQEYQAFWEKYKEEK